MAFVAIVADAIGYDPFPGGHDLVAALPAIAYIVLPGAVIAMLTWNRSARMIGGQNTALLMNLVPITVLVVELIRGYRPAGLEVAGAVLVVATVSAHNLYLRRTAAARRGPTVLATPSEQAA
jgi:drug/metabolite transporter (DMT)-like permease